MYLLEFIRIFVEYLPKYFWRVKLIADCYRSFSLKQEEQEDRRAFSSLKLSITFMNVFYATMKTKKKFIRVTFTAFQSKCNLLFSKDENRYSYCVSWCRNNKIWKFWLYSNTFFDIFPRRGRQKVVLHAKVWLEETNDTITIRSSSGDTDIVILVTSLLWKFRW